MRWLAYLVAELVVEFLAVILASALPLFASDTIGPVNNNSASAREPRLPDWLAWFQTPDNSLLGDEGWRASHSGGYWSQVGWLLRNRAYGFKWTVLAAPMDHIRIIEGDTKINRNNGRYGLLRITMGHYWQWKLVKPIGSTGWCWMLNFGWLLDDDSQERALFLFSPRIVSLKQGGV